MSIINAMTNTFSDYKVKQAYFYLILTGVKDRFDGFGFEIRKCE